MSVLLRCSQSQCSNIKEFPDDYQFEGRPIWDWWLSVGQRCSECRDKGEQLKLLSLPTTPIPGKVGHNHPRTSRVAARLVIPRAGTERAKIIQVIGKVWPDGLNAYEVWELAHLRSPNQTATRLGELRDDYDPPWLEYLRDENGQIVEHPATFGNTGQAYRLTPEGIAMFPELPY